MGSLLVAFAFLFFIGVSVMAGKLPSMAFAFYMIASATAFAAYAWDKSAARRHRWRTRERTLHLISLAGGWPGALCAQSILRHKSSKAPFQAMFWTTVVIHCCILAWLLSPFSANTMRTIM